MTVNSLSARNISGRRKSAALQAVEPGQAVRRFVSRKGNHLYIAEQTYGLDSLEWIIVLGLGKVTQAMAHVLLDVLPLQTTHGLLIPKQAFSSPQLDAKFMWDGILCPTGTASL